MRVPRMIALALAAVLAVSGPALAQTLPGWTSGLLVSYNLADVEAADPLTGFAAEVDFRFAACRSASSATSARRTRARSPAPGSA